MGRLRAEAVRRAHAFWAAKPVFIDTETTGLNQRAEIVEISIVDYDGKTLFDNLVHPRSPIPPDVIRLHGIDNDMVKDAPGWDQVWPQVESILRERYTGIYNLEFDVRMMKQSHLRHGLAWRPPNIRFFDIMKLYSDFYGAYRWQRLEDAGRQCGIPLMNTHRAKDDALLARAVLEYMANSQA
ncbi:MAG: 3'-5' exonuclease [Anaerolineales bacterium]